MFSERLKKIRKYYNLTQAQFADKLGIKQSAYSNYEAGTREPSISMVGDILTHFSINEKWLLTGIGEMQGKAVVSNLRQLPKVENLVKEESARYSKAPIVVTVDEKGRDNVVLVPAKVAAGYLVGFADPEYIEKLPAFRLPGLHGSNFRMFEVSGDSMYPTLKSSDLAVCEYVSNFDQIRDDRVYVVVSKEEGLIVKRLLNRIHADEKIICKSDNQDGKLYPPIILEPGQIQELWYVKMFISHQLNSPSEYWSRLQDLEGRVAIIEAEKQKK